MFVDRVEIFVKGGDGGRDQCRGRNPREPGLELVSTVQFNAQVTLSLPFWLALPSSATRSVPPPLLTT